MVSYVAQSREVVDELDPEVVGGFSLGDITYRNNFFAQYALGEVEVAGEPLQLALGLPLARTNGQTVFTASLTQAICMLERAPELAAHLPGFMGALAVGEEKAYWAAALLTEDVTAGNGRSHPLEEPTGIVAEKSVQLGIPVSGPYSLPVVRSAGVQRIAGLYPSRMHLETGKRRDVESWVGQAQPSLTVVIEPESALAASLKEQAQRLV